MKPNLTKKLTLGHPGHRTGIQTRSSSSPWKPNFFGKKLSFAFLFLIVVGGLLYWQTAQGVNRTWDGGGVDGTCGGAGTANNWSCAANWSGDVAPGASDVAIFDGTSTKDATINAAISVAGISINLGYTGTITQSSTYTVTVGSSHWVQAAGTFTGGSGTVDINGTFTLSGGTFTSTSGTLEVGRNSTGSETIFAVSGGTFIHNNGSVVFAAYNSGGGSTYTIDVATTLTLYNVTTNSNTEADEIFSVAGGDTLIMAGDFTQTGGQIAGTWEVLGNVVIGSGADGGTGTLTYTGTGAKTYTHTAGGFAPHLRVNNAGVSVSANGGTTTLGAWFFSLLAGTFTAPSGTFTIGRNGSSATYLTVSLGTTFTHNSGSITFTGTDSGGSAVYTIDVSTTLTLYSVTVTSGENETFSVAGGDTLIMAGDFTQTGGQIAGTWEVQGNYTVATTADGGTAGITFTGGNNQTYTDQGGNEPDGDVLVNKSAGTVTLASNADWNAASQDVTITGGTLASATYNITTVNFTVNGGTFTGGSGTVTTSGPMVVSSGTFTGGAGNIDINNVFTLSGGTFTSTSGTLEVGHCPNSNVTFLTVSGGTFNHNNGTVSFACSSGGNWYLTYTVDVSTSLTLYDIVVNITAGSNFNTLTTASGDTVIAANDFTHTNGALLGTWQVQGNIVIGAGADGGTGTLTMTGTGAHTYAYTAGGVGPHLRVNHASATVSAAGGTTDLTVRHFSLLAGAFTAPSGTLSVGRTMVSIGGTFFTVSGGAFNHNNGTVTFVETCSDCAGATQTIDTQTTLTLYNVIVNSATNNNIIEVAGGDTIVATNNFTHTNGKLAGTWQVQGNYTIATTADGGTAGITFTGGNNQTYTDQGGNEPDGDVTINKTSGTVTLASNADWNASGQDVTITSGELNMGASYNISTTTLIVATAGHLSNYGTGDLTLAGNVSNAGNIRFRSNGTCGGTDDILIRSSVGGTQRTWSGSGTFLFHDVNVQDQGGSATITAYSSTSVSGNGVNWTFSGAACPAQPPAAGLSTGKINLQSGTLNLR